MKLCRPTRIAHLLIGCVLLLNLGAPLGRATVLRKLSTDELVRLADGIAVGRCESVETLWLQRKIFTVATVRVEQTVKGATLPGGTLKVYILGGRVKKPLPVRMYVPGAATIARGEEMLLFLKTCGIDKPSYRLVGMSQGKISIHRAKTGEEYLLQDKPVQGVRFVDREGRLLTPETRSASSEGRRLDGFIDEIKRIMAQQESTADKSSEATEATSQPAETGNGGSQ